MSASHVIEQLDFDIAFHCRDAVLEDGEELTALLKDVLLPIIDEVLDAYDKPGMVLRLDAVELDVGAIPRAGFARSIGPRVRAALEDTLEQLMAESVAPAPGPQGGEAVAATRQTQSEAELTDLMQFLATGRLPWHIAKGNERAHEAQLARLLEKGSEGLWTVLRSALGQRASARRLVTQYAQPLLLAIVRTRAPGHSEGVARMMDRFRAMARTKRFAAMSEARVMELCWKRVLQEFLAPAPEAIQLATLESHMIADIDALSSPQSLTELEQFALFLATGRMSSQNPQAQLDRLLAAGGDAFWLALAEAARHSEQTARLVAHYAPSQLLSLLRMRAPALADGVHEMLGQLRARAGHGQFVRVSEADIAQLGWQYVLTQCLALPAPVTDRHALERGIVARLHAGSAHSEAAAELELLARYLATGLPAAGAGNVHEARLARLLESGGDAVWNMLADAMRHPERVLRLATQFPESMLCAILRKRAPAQADAVLSMLKTLRAQGASQMSKGDAAAWSHVLAQCLAQPLRTIDLPRLERTIAADLAAGASAGAGPLTAAAGATRDLDQLALFLSTGRIPHSSQAGQYAHEEQLARLLKAPDDALWTVLSGAMAQPDRAQRLTSQYADALLLEIVRQRTASHALAVARMLASLRARARAGGMPGVSEAKIAQMGWAVILAWCLAPNPLTASFGELERSMAALAPETPDADMELLTSFIETGRHLQSPVQALDRLLERNDGRLKQWLAVVMSRPEDVQRLVQHFSERQLVALSRLAVAGPVLAKPTPVPTPNAGEDKAWAALRRFLQDGSWPHASNQSPADVILGLPASRTEPLRTMLAAALHAPSGARRLFAQLTQAQLVLIVRRFSPSHAAQQTAVVEEWARRTGVHPLRLFDARWLTQLCWQKVLAASLARTPECDSILTGLTKIMEAGLAAAAPLRLAPATPRSSFASAQKKNRQTLASFLVRDHWPGSPLAPPAGMSAAALREQVTAFIRADASVSSTRRLVFFDSIDSAAPRTGDVRPFWHAVATILAHGEALDLEAIAVSTSGPAEMRRAIATGNFTGLNNAINAILRTDPAQVARELDQFSRSPGVRAALASRLPPTILRALATRLAPSVAQLVDIVLAGRARFTQLLAADAGAALWSAVLPLCATSPGAITAADFARRLCEAAGSAAPLRLQAVSAALSGAAAPAAGIGATQPTGPSPVVPHEYSTLCFPTALNPNEAMALNNAGLVLAAPYLPRLLDMFGLVRAGAFVDGEAAERAVHLMQFVVTGCASTPEYELTLNKLLCGLAPDAPVAAGIDLTAHEQDTIEGMLKAMIAAWRTLGGTSVAGLRQSFLARGGTLQLQEDAWQLRVEQGPFDMLLDRIPWGFSIIKFGWMPQPVHVTWRPS